MTTISEILRNNYTDGNSMFHTHVSLIQPKGSFQLDRHTLENFWEKYCLIIDTDIHVGIAEKSQHFLPVLVDVDLKIDATIFESINQEIQREHIYTQEHIIKIIEIYHSVLRNIVQDCSDEHLICVLLEKPIYHVNKGSISYLKNGFHLHFPYLFINKDDQQAQLVPRIKELVRDGNIFADLGIENSGDMIDNCLLYTSPSPRD